MPNHKHRLLGELAGVARGLARAPTLALDWRSLPRGQGPVMLLPGFAAADGSTIVLRQTLERLGYAALGWGLGRNHGNHRVLLPRLVERVARVADEHRRPLALIGWSLGGMFAREATRARPELVRSIVTLGTPVMDADRPSLTVPITAIYSKRDAIVPWQSCLDPNPDNAVEHVEVDATHFELGVAPEVLKIIASVLARDLGSG